MPNGYTTVPQIIPGTLSIGGDLDVKGEIRVGPFTSRLHLFMTNDFTAWLTYNWKKDNANPDEAGSKSNMLILGDGQQVPAFEFRNTAPVRTQAANRQILYSRTVQSVHTGGVAESTIDSKIIPATLIGLNGALRVVCFFNVTVQGGVASTFRVKLGATTLLNIPIGGVIGPTWIEVLIANQNVGNSQLVLTVQWLGTGNAVFENTAAVNTLAQQTLTITMQNGAASDSQNFDVTFVELVNTFGPVNEGLV